MRRKHWLLEAMECVLAAAAAEARSMRGEVEMSICMAAVGMGICLVVVMIGSIRVVGVVAGIHSDKVAAARVREVVVMSRRMVA